MVLKWGALDFAPGNFLVGRAVGVSVSWAVLVAR